MTQYTDYIGSGTAGATAKDYDTFALWIAASATETRSADDELRVIFQSSSTGHNGNHPFGGDLTVLDQDVDFTLTLSSTNLTGSGPMDGGLIMDDTANGGANNDLELQAAGADKTFNFNNLDISIGQNDRNINVQRDLSSDSDELGSNITLNFNNTRIVSPSSSNENGMINCSPDAASLTGYQTFNFTNCIFSPAKHGLRQFPGGGGQSSNIIVNGIGSSFFNARTTFFVPNRDSNSNFELHLSGCMFEWTKSQGNPSFYNGLIRPFNSGYTSGTAIDYITNESDSVVSKWTTDAGGTKTNVSAGATFVYGVEPTAGEIGFSGPIYGNNPFDLLAGTMDLRLWNSTNNAASGFVSNVTLPSPDLAGRNRGSSPFDAGPYEITAGSVGPIDTRPTFKIVRVNMYN